MLSFPVIIVKKKRYCSLLSAVVYLSNVPDGLVMLYFPAIIAKKRHCSLLSAGVNPSHVPDRCHMLSFPVIIGKTPDIVTSISWC